MNKIRITKQLKILNVFLPLEKGDGQQDRGMSEKTKCRTHNA